MVNEVIIEKNEAKYLIANAIKKVTNGGVIAVKEFETIDSNFELYMEYSLMEDTWHHTSKSNNNDKKKSIF